jgi:hypothetical protein
MAAMAAIVHFLIVTYRSVLIEFPGAILLRFEVLVKLEIRKNSRKSEGLIRDRTAGLAVEGEPGLKNSSIA